MKRLSKMATLSDHKDFVIIDKSLIEKKAQQATENERLREIHILHQEHKDNLHRMLNAFQPKSYVVPHRHLEDPKDEAIIILKGSIGCICFNEDGSIIPESVCYLSQNSDRIGLDVRAGVWHTFFALEKDTVIFEVKSGPYTRATDKDFAPWAPKEDSPDALAYLAKLEDTVREKFDLEKRNWSF
jgi:cupin fold WbuC family metalloprotein